MTQKQFNIEEARQISQGKKLGSIKTRDGFRVTMPSDLVIETEGGET